MGKFKHGIGTKHPFRFLTFDGKSASEIKSALEGLNLKGLSYKIMDTQDSSGEKINGVYIVIEDWAQWQPTELAFAMMQLSTRWESPSPFNGAKNLKVIYLTNMWVPPHGGIIYPLVEVLFIPPLLSSGGTGK